MQHNSSFPATENLLLYFFVFRLDRTIERDGFSSHTFQKMPCGVFAETADFALAAAIARFPNFRGRLAVSRYD